MAVECGCNVVVCAKTVLPDPKLPGTIHTVVDEIRAQGGQAAAFQLDVQNASECQACADFAFKTFGSVDIVINNASALWWRKIVDTPLSRFDLMLGVNARGSFALTRACLPYMNPKWGFVISMSPPIEDASNLNERTAYAISKLGMTLVAMGVAAEYRGQGIAGHSLWPATVVESYASENFAMGDRSSWRTAQVLVDSVLCILSQNPVEFTGKTWIDEDLLRNFGVEDFKRYRCDPDVEPPTMRELAGSGDAFSRGKALTPSERAVVAEQFKQARKAKL